MLRRHLNFRKISHRFTSSFANSSFQDLNGSHIMYWNMIILNPSRFKFEPHSKYWYFCIERWDLLSLRFSENAVLFHIEWLCRKTAGKVNRPPYRYTAVTHWACPPSSEGDARFQIFCPGFHCTEVQKLSGISGTLSDSSDRLCRWGLKK